MPSKLLTIHPFRFMKARSFYQFTRHFASSKYEQISISRIENHSIEVLAFAAYAA